MSWSYYDTLIDVLSQSFQELYESYRSFSRNQWQSKSVPTQEAMSALGRNQKLSQREDDRTEVSGNPGSKEAGSNRNEIVDVYNSWCTAGMNEVQFDMPEGVSRLI